MEQNWSEIARALRQINHNQLAKEIDKEVANDIMCVASRAICAQGTYPV